MSSRALRKLQKEKEAEREKEKKEELEEEDMFPGGGARSKKVGSNPFDMGLRFTTSSDSEGATGGVKTPSCAKPKRVVKKKKGKSKAKKQEDKRAMSTEEKFADDAEVAESQAKTDGGFDIEIVQADAVMSAAQDVVVQADEVKEAARVVVVQADEVKEAARVEVKKTRESSKSKKDKKKGKIGPVVDEFEVERSLMQVNRMLGELEIPSSSGSHADTKNKPTLYIQNRLLDPMNEIKKERKTHHKPLNSKFFNSRLATPKRDWPFTGKPLGLTMQLVKNEEGIMYFAYDHSTFYQHIEFSFLDIIDTPQASNLFQFLNEYPFHVDSLIQCANMSARRNDTEMEREMISRALYYLESATHSSFSFSQGNSRLEYKYQENRCFHIALLRQMSLASLKNAHRTSLELCKLALSLDESDPLALILLIDLFALLSQEYKWLVDLFRELNPVRNLSLLPNMAYSIALAHFKLAKATGGDLAVADEFLQKAIQNFPSILIPLVEETNKFALCSSVRDHDYFKEDTEESMTPSLEQLCKAYVIRCASVWRTPELCEWVEENAKQLVESDSLDPANLQNIKKLFSSKPPFPIQRHFVLARDLVSLTRNQETSEFESNWDPFPPLDGVEKYLRKGLIVQRLAPAARRSATMAFIQSISPNFDMN